jgi:hypothetical protein
MGLFFESQGSNSPLVPILETAYKENAAARSPSRDNNTKPLHVFQPRRGRSSFGPADHPTSKSKRGGQIECPSSIQRALRQCDLQGPAIRSCSLDISGPTGHGDRMRCIWIDVINHRSVQPRGKCVRRHRGLFGRREGGVSEPSNRPRTTGCTADDAGRLRASLSPNQGRERRSASSSILNLGGCVLSLSS